MFLSTNLNSIIYLHACILCLYSFIHTYRGHTCNFMASLKTQRPEHQHQPIELMFVVFLLFIAIHYIFGYLELKHRAWRMSLSLSYIFSQSRLYVLVCFFVNLIHMGKALPMRQADFRSINLLNPKVAMRQLLPPSLLLSQEE